jgi:enoyl-CoA hydratase/carnithine racemase
MSGLIATEVEDRICVIELNDPASRNALSADMRSALTAALAEADARGDIHAAVVKGAGGHFCAGGDIRTMAAIVTRADAEARMRAVSETVLAIAGFSKPLVACVEGHAAGAGIGLALLADTVIAAANATFTFSFRRLALGPDWGLSFTLPQRVGIARARQWILRGDAISASNALNDGLADAVVEPASTRSAAIGAAKTLSAPPRQTGSTARILLSKLEDLAAALDREAALQSSRFLSDEHRLEVKAFLEKRNRPAS